MYVRISPFSSLAKEKKNLSHSLHDGKKSKYYKCEIVCARLMRTPNGRRCCVGRVRIVSATLARPRKCEEVKMPNRRIVRN